MIGFLLGLSGASCVLAWLVWREASQNVEAAQPDLKNWQPRRPYRMLR
jgi:hypothetical protein